jgi:hypothetical protein
MGLFFHNIHVRLGPDDRAPVVAAITDAIRDCVCRGPFEEVKVDDGGPLHRLVLVCEHRDWVSVYPDARSSERLVTALSRAGGQALLCSVRDSAWLDVWLYTRGRLVDWAAAEINRPDPDAEPRSTRLPALDAWAHLLGSHEVAGSVRELWRSPPDKVEALLAETCRLAGIAPKLCTRGLHDIIAEQGSSTPAGGLLLGFRATAAAEWLAPESAAPKLTPPEYCNRGDAVVGERFTWTPESYLSVGGAGLGVKVRLVGGPIEESLVSNLRARLRKYRPNRLEEQPLVSDNGGLAARFENWPIPAGIGDEAAWTAALQRDADIASVDTSLRTWLSLSGQGRSAGQGDCTLCIEPIGNARGSAECQFPVRIVGRNR